MSGGCQPLRWFVIWAVAGALFVAWVIYESLAPDPIQTPGLMYGDKIGHFLAYFIMMGWFVQLFHRRHHGLLLVIFTLLGVMLEFLQGQSGYRLFEYGDMAANSLGALSAWLLAAGSFSMLLLRLEQRLSR